MAEITGSFPAVATKFDTEEGPTYAQFGEAKTGTKQILMQFRILEGEHAGYVVPYIGYFTTATVDGTLKALRTAGMKGEDLTTLYGDNAQELNQVVSIVVEMKPNADGSKSYPQVRWVNSPGGGAGFTLKKSLGKAELGKFAAQMKSKLRAVQEVAGEAPGAESEGHNGAPSIPPPVVDDDLPDFLR